MKTRFIILIAVGFIGVLANPVSKQTIASDNKNPSQLESIESQTKHEEPTLNNGEQKNGETIDIIEPDDSDTKDTNCDGKVDIIIEESVVDHVDDTPNLIEDEQSSIDQFPNPIDELPLVPSPIDFIPPVQSPIDLFAPAERSNDLFAPAERPIELLPPAQSPIDVLPQVPIQDVFEDDFPVTDLPSRDAPINAIQDEIMETAAGFAPIPLLFRRKNKPRRRFANRRHFAPNPFRRKFHFFYPYYGFYRPSSLRFY